VDHAVPLEPALDHDLHAVVEGIGRQAMKDDWIARAAVGHLEAQRLGGDVLGHGTGHDASADFHADVIEGRIDRDLLRELRGRQEVLARLLHA